MVLADIVDQVDGEELRGVQTHVKLPVGARYIDQMPA